MQTAADSESGRGQQASSRGGSGACRTWALLPLVGLLAVGLMGALRLGALLDGSRDFAAAASAGTTAITLPGRDALHHRGLVPLAPRLEAPELPVDEPAGGLSLADFEEGEEEGGGSPRGPSEGASGAGAGAEVESDSEEEHEAGAWGGGEAGAGAGDEGAGAQPLANLGNIADVRAAIAAPRAELASLGQHRAIPSVAKVSRSSPRDGGGGNSTLGSPRGVGGTSRRSVEERIARANKTLPPGAEWCGEARLSQPRSFLAGVTVAKHIAMFAGGVTRREAVTSRVDIYNARTRQWSTASLSVPRSGAGAVSVGSLALFAGGMGRRVESQVIDIYDAAANRWSSAKMSMPRKFVAACAVDTEEHQVVVIAGGTAKMRTGFNEKSSRVDIFDAKRRKWSTAKLREGRTKLSCAGVGTKIVVAGGYGERGYSRTVDILDVATRKWRTARLSTSRQWAAAATAPPLAFFAGGQWCNIGPCNGGWIRDGTIDVYNSETDTLQRAHKMMEARSNAAAASTPGGEWVAYAGGNFNVDPTRYFKDPSCRCNCVPLPKFFPAQSSDAERGHMIPYPKTPARNCRPKRDSYPVFSKSSALDIYNGATRKWSAARLPVARALNAAAGVAGADGLQMLFAGGEIRTMHQQPTNRGGLDYYTARVDLLCLSGG
eukprot:jgi/Tetstr1/459731/TSEL_005084.t1